jgi:putative ABC transport system permease protein
MEAAGFGLPEAALAVKPSTVIWAVGVGMVVTLIASVAPAVRASRVSPLAALRDVALDRTGRSTVRVVAGVLVTGAGTALVLGGALASSENALPSTGLGALMLVIGAVILGPVVARPAAAVLGAPLPRLRRMTGRLAQQNAMRNPRRTAATASALLVGVAVVTLFTVFAASVKAAIDHEIDRSFAGDLVIANQNFSSPGLSPQLAADVGQLPEVEAATGSGLGAMRVQGEDVDVTVVEPPTFARLFDVGVTDGSVAALADTQIAVSEEEAADKGWAVGDTVDAFFAADGATEPLTIGAIYSATTSAGHYIVPAAVWTPHVTQAFDIVVMVKLADGVSLADGKAAVQTIADRYFAPDVQDRDEYTADIAAQIDVFLTIIYAMLALAILIALMGIANTLSLSIYERTRELGLLRAVGQSRGQVRAMVRWESVIIAVFGTMGGIVVGLFLGWGMVEVVARSEGIQAPYAIPAARVVAVLLAGALVGVLAGFRPARRASKLNVLEAIATE